MIVIIGAGISGLSLGWALVQRGEPVTILEAGAVAGRASGVATCYLEPRLGHTPIRAVERSAHGAWPAFAAALEAASGQDVAFRDHGQIKVSVGDNLAKFEKDLATRRAEGWAVDDLSIAEAQALAPALADNLAAAAFLPGISWVDGRKTCAALRDVIEAAGGTIREHWPVDRLKQSPEGFTVYNRDGQHISATKIVLCTGLGDPAVYGLPPEIKPTRPVRGVNLVLDQTGLARPFRHLVKHHRGNLCPRANGELLVGTTFEPGITDLVPGADVIERLYANAEPIFPAVRSLPLVRVATGVRAKIGDGNLFVGESTTMPGLFYSLSHAGAGYLRAPIVSKELAGLVANGTHGPLTGFLTAA